MVGRSSKFAALRRRQGTHARVEASAASLAGTKIAGGDERWMMLMSTHPSRDVRIGALEQLR